MDYIFNIFEHHSSKCSEKKVFDEMLQDIIKVYVYEFLHNMKSHVEYLNSPQSIYKIKDLSAYIIGRLKESVKDNKYKDEILGTLAFYINICNNELGYVDYDKICDFLSSEINKKRK